MHNRTSVPLTAFCLGCCSLLKQAHAETPPSNHREMPPLVVSATNTAAKCGDLLYPPTSLLLLNSMWISSVMPPHLTREPKAKKKKHQTSGSISAGNELMVSCLLFVAVLLGLCHRMALTPCSCARRPGSGAASSQRGYPQQQLPGGWEGRERKVSFLPIPFQPCVLGKEPCPPCFLKTKWRR